MFFLLTFVVSYSEDCPQYKCKSLGNKMCVSPEGSQVLVDSCSGSEFCDLKPLPSHSYCKSKSDSLPYAWPGEPCKSAQCKFGYCNGSKCIGAAYNETCLVSDECNPGLYCKKGLCKYLKHVGDSGCSSDFDCEYISGCMNGRCVEYNSIHEGFKVECVQNKSEFCITGACYKDYCLGELTNDRGEGVECQDDGDCYNSMYNTSAYPFLFYSKCQCGLSGKKYCELFPADPTYIKHRWSLYDWIDSGHIDNCNTVRRFAPYCIEKKWHMNRYIKLMYYNYLANSFSYVKNAENCVLRIMSPDYYKYSDLHSFSNVLKSGFLVIFWGLF